MSSTLRSIGSAALLAAGLLLAGPVVALSPERPVPVAPSETSGSGVARSCPTFHWVPAPGAGRHELVVRRLSADDVPGDAVLEETLSDASASWTPSFDRCLERGFSYSWLVRAIGVDGRSADSETVLFRVAPRPSVREVEEALAVIERYLQQEPEVEPWVLGGSVSAIAMGTEETPVVGVEIREGAILIHGRPVIALPIDP